MIFAGFCSVGTYLNSTCLNPRCKVLNLSSFRQIYFVGFIASFVNQAKTVMESVRIINFSNLPLNAFNVMTAACAPFSMAINYFLGIDYVSAYRGTTQLFASMNDVQFSFTNYAAAPYACAEASQKTCNVTSEAVDRPVSLCRTCN